MRHLIDIVSNQSNVLVKGASVSVFIAGTQTLAVLYSDDGLTTKANPVITDTNGGFDFFVADGRYDIQVSGAGIATKNFLNLEIADLTESSGADVPWNSQLLSFTNQAVNPVPPLG